MKPSMERRGRLWVLWLAGVCVIILVFTLIQYAFGWYLSYTFTPNLFEIYQRTDVLEQKVALGGDAGGKLLFLCLLIASIAVYSITLWKKTIRQ